MTFLTSRFFPRSSLEVVKNLINSSSIQDLHGFGCRLLSVRHARPLMIFDTKSLYRSNISVKKWHKLATDQVLYGDTDQQTKYALVTVGDSV